MAREEESAGMQVIRSGLCSGVQDPARGTAKLNRVARGDHLELRDGFLRNCEGVVGAFTTANSAEEGFVIVGAINRHVSVDPALPGKGDAIALRFDLHRGCQCGKVLETPPTDR